MYATTKIVKIAASAAIRQYIPTTPRDGRLHRTSPPGIVTEGALIILLVLPIGIFRMLNIPERTPAFHLRQHSEVIARRRRSGGPFQGPGIPWVASGKLTSPAGP